MLGKKLTKQAGTSVHGVVDIVSKGDDGKEMLKHR